MVLFYFAGVDAAVLFAADAHDVPEGPRSYFLDKLVLFLNLVFHFPLTHLNYISHKALLLTLKTQ